MFPVINIGLCGGGLPLLFLGGAMAQRGPDQP